MSDMAATGLARSLRARWVFPVSEPPLKDATVTIADGRIVAVGTESTDAPVEDLGDVALIPGLVNAHTHLEFSDLDLPPTVRKDVRLIVNLKDIGTLLDVNGSLNAIFGP